MGAMVGRPLAYVCLLGVAMTLLLVVMLGARILQGSPDAGDAPARTAGVVALSLADRFAAEVATADRVLGDIAAMVTTGGAGENVADRGGGAENDSADHRERDTSAWLERVLDVGGTRLPHVSAILIIDAGGNLVGGSAPSAIQDAVLRQISADLGSAHPVSGNAPDGPSLVVMPGEGADPARGVAITHPVEIDGGEAPLFLAVLIDNGLIAAFQGDLGLDPAPLAAIATPQGRVLLGDAPEAGEPTAAGVEAMQPQTGEGHAEWVTATRPIGELPVMAWAAVRADTSSGVLTGHGTAFVAIALLAAWVGGFAMAVVIGRRQGNRIKPNPSEALEWPWDRFFAGTTDLLCIADLSGRIRQVNDSWEERLGWRPHDVLGRALVTLSHPADSDHVAASWQQLHRDQQRIQFEARFRNANGAYHWLVWSCLRDQVAGICAYGRDVSDIRRHETALKDEEAKYRSLIGDAGIAMFQIDSSGRLLEANRRAGELLLHPVDDLMAMTLYDIHPVHEVPRLLRRYLRCFQESETATERAHILRGDGTTAPVEIAARAVNVSDGGGVLQIIMRDVTAQEAAETLFREYQERLEREVAARTLALEQANEEVKNFAYIISHDLRAPLVSVHGFAGELDRLSKELHANLAPVMDLLPNDRRQTIDALLGNECGEAIGFLRGAARKMDTLLSGLLKLSRVGRQEPNVKAIDVRTVIDDILHSLEFQIQQSGVRIRIDDMPTMISDANLVPLIFANLLSNAVKYLDTSRDGIIHVWAEAGDTKTVFHVRDNGRGIAVEDVPRVFTIFRRVGPQDTPGEGIGLSYVQTAVRRCGGDISVESVEGEGSTFSFSLANEFPSQVLAADQPESRRAVS